MRKTDVRNRIDSILATNPKYPDKLKKLSTTLHYARKLTVFAIAPDSSPPATRRRADGSDSPGRVSQAAPRPNAHSAEECRARRRRPRPRLAGRWWHP